MRCATWAALLACTACAAPAPPERVPPAPANPAILMLSGHGRRVERSGDTLYAVGGFSRGNKNPERDTRQTLAFDLPAGPWIRRSSTHESHAFAGSAVVDGSLYAVSGTLERYDDESDRWAVVAGTDSLPRTHLAAAAHGTAIHVIGGYPAERAGHHVFDAKTGALREARVPPGFDPGDHLHVVASLGGRLHCVGGIDGESFDVSDDHHAFDGQAWHECARPPMPVWAKFAACAVINEALYVFESTRGLRYDSATDSWSDVAPLPAYLAMPTAVVIDDRVFVLDGMPVEDDPPAVYVYDPKTDRWARH